MPVQNEPNLLIIPEKHRENEQSCASGDNLVLSIVTRGVTGKAPIDGLSLKARLERKTDAGANVRKQ